MKIRILLIVLFTTLSISCVKDEEDSECFTQMIAYLENAEESYDSQIATIRDPDGTWHTIEQCLEQKALALSFLNLYEETEEEFNTDSYYSKCSEEEKNKINNVLERLIIEMEGDAYIYYDCE